VAKQPCSFASVIVQRRDGGCELLHKLGPVAAYWKMWIMTDAFNRIDVMTSLS
jgi:hypothetical protein